LHCKFSISALKIKEENAPGRSNLLQLIMPKHITKWQERSQAKRLQVLLRKSFGMEEPVSQVRQQLEALYLREKRSAASKSEGVLTHPFFFFN
jgi:hypothetical protein